MSSVVSQLWDLCLKHFLKKECNKNIWFFPQAGFHSLPPSLRSGEIFLKEFKRWSGVSCIWWNMESLGLINPCTQSCLEESAGVTSVPQGDSFLPKTTMLRLFLKPCCSQTSLMPALHQELAKSAENPALHHSHHVPVSGSHIPLLMSCPNVKSNT